ncbi:S-layer homology domain-containing protein [Nodosilinea sp. PGN35]|uniref:S-layer homology domain-containing protein n=1 Tax=Nodosilinea sp. PGN35 TaxID=3020489 RepID=UPI0023B250CA|nr:S-layer homology domain-containing protein [Nodosilinea sp. TSF1-S3]MDF0365385.1 S-layer homology domain-containing protein [Nodosilinea sp. TSF1-S3]
MGSFFSDAQVDQSNYRRLQEWWWLQGNLGRSRWKRWFRVAGTGAPKEDEIENVEVKKEDLNRVLEITRERQYGKQAKQFTVAKDQTTFLPLTSLEVGTERSRAICRIARYFSLKAWNALISSIEVSENVADYTSEATLREIFAIPEQVAEDIFRPTDTYNPAQDSPLKALRSLDESQLAKINPIPIGTGFLVGGTHLMTNHHVIADPEEALECVAQFNYVRDSTGLLQQSVDYTFAPSMLFVTNAALDYSLVQLEAGQFTRQAGYVFGWLQLVGDESNVAPGLSADQVKQLNALEPNGAKSQHSAQKVKPILGDRVLLVQHPKGQEKQLVQNDNRVLDYDKNGLLDNFVRYTTGSDYGSSGSPVFNINWDLVALHHAAIAEAETLPQENTFSKGDETLRKDTMPNSISDEPAATAAIADNKSKKPVIEAYQGVRICRIVEDLQQKGRELPKLKSFLEDFVVTQEQLNHLPFPAGIQFRGAEQYVSVSNVVSVLTVSPAGHVTLWSPEGAALKRLSLPNQETIDHICLKTDGKLLAVARSPQSDQRSFIELWAIEMPDISSAKLTCLRTFIGNHPLWKTPAKIGDLNFSSDGEAIAAISIDGYIDIWHLDGTLIKSLDILATAYEHTSVQQFEKTISEINLHLEKLNSYFKGIEQDPYGETFQLLNELASAQGTRLTPEGWLGTLHEEITKGQKRVDELTIRASHFYEENPVVGYCIPHSILIYGTYPRLAIERDDKFVSLSTPIEKFRLKSDGTGAFLTLSGGSPYYWDFTDSPFISLADYINFPEIKSSFIRDFVLSSDESILALASHSIEICHPNNGLLISSDPVNYEIKEIKISENNRVVLALSENGHIDAFDVSDGRPLGRYASEDAIAFSVNLDWQASRQKSAISFGQNNLYSLEAWVKPNTANAGIILVKGTQYDIEYSIFIAYGKIYFVRMVGLPISRLLNSTIHDPVNMGMLGIHEFHGGKIDVNSFLHIAVVFDGNVIRLYLQGELAAAEDLILKKQFSPIHESMRAAASSELFQSSLMIGGLTRYLTGSSNSASIKASFDGVIAEVRIWNTARTQEQIQANMRRRLPPSAKTEGLVGYWRFEETQENQVRNLVGDGDYGIVIGAERLTQVEVPLPLPVGLEFRHPGDRVSCGQVARLETPTAITLEAWVKHSYGNGVIASCQGVQGSGYALIWQDQKIRVILHDQNSAIRTVLDTRGSVPSDRAFHHIAFTWDQASQEIQVYIDSRRQDTVSIKGDYETIPINGQYRSTGLFKGLLASDNEPFYIGAMGSSPAGGGQRQWVIAEVRLWNVARTQNQIRATMSQHLVEPKPGLVGYWRLDDGGAIAHNQVAIWQGRSGPEHHGSIQGATWFPAALPAPNIAPVISEDLDFERHSGINSSEARSGGETGGTKSKSGNVESGSASLPADVPSDHWARFWIRAVINKQAMPLNTQGQFEPNNGVSTGDYVTAIAAAFDRPLRLDATVFRNLSATEAPYAAAQKAYRMGFLLLPQDNTLDLQRQITRLEAIVCFVRGFNLKGGTLNLVSGYPDSTAIPEGLRSLVATALRHGLVVIPNGAGQLTPHRPLTRAELAAMIYQGQVIEGRADLLSSPHLVHLEEPLALFVDVLNPSAPPHWAEGFIRGLLDLGLINGFSDGTFRPDARVSRADFASLLVSAFDPSPRGDRLQANVSQLFRDVPTSHPQLRAIQQIYRSGAMSGLDNGTFGVAAAISREQAIAALVAILDLRAATTDSLTRYPDRATISPWAQGAIAAATEAELIVTPDSTAPQIRANQAATRAEIATLVYQGLVIRGVASPIL